MLSGWGTTAYLLSQQEEKSTNAAANSENKIDLDFIVLIFNMLFILIPK
jgi:hypothetical protein